MTRNESFKKRIRERMAQTGEKYGAARRVLIDRSARSSGRSWVDEPELSDDRVREATGRGWDEWCELIEAWPGHSDGHSAIATWVNQEHGVDGWWAQSVTVGFERITGLRRRHQRADGTFTANKSRTLAADHTTLRELLLDADGRESLFPGIDTELRSRPGSKVVRLAVGPGVAQIALDPLPDGRLRIAVSHERLTSADEVEAWKAFWGEWFDALAAAADDSAASGTMGP